MNDWNKNLETYKTKEYTCPFCGNKVASKEYFSTSSNEFKEKAEIWICPHCKNPTIFIEKCVRNLHGINKWTLDKMIPNNKIGKDDIRNLPEDIKLLYDEIRNSYQANAFDGVSLLTRTLLLMLCENLDTTNTIDKDSSYKDCVDYLINNDYIPKNSKKYADDLRNTANEFTHELQKVTKEKAEELIYIVEFLLVTIYQYGEKINNSLSH